MRFSDGCTYQNRKADLCAKCTASSQERNFRDTRKSVRSAHKWTEDVSQLQDPHLEKQQPTDTLETFLGLSDSSTSSDSSNRAPSGLLWRCFHVGGRLRWGSLSSYLSDHLWFCLEAHSFCFLRLSHRRRLLQKYLFFGWHWCPRNGLLEGKIGVMTRPHIGEVRVGARMTSKQHPLGIRDIGIIGDLANSQLSPAVVPEFKAVCNFCFFVEFLAKLCGEKKAISDKVYIVKQVSFHKCTLPTEPFPILRVGFV
jgi:hypothetical protein